MPHVTFIHGIANKPPAEELLAVWQRSLGQDEGINLATKGITSSMVYWADVLYAEPSESQSDNESVDEVPMVEASDEDLTWVSTLEGEEKAFVDKFAGKLNFDAPSPGNDDFRPEPSEDEGFERIPLPWFIKRRLMKILLRDVHHYLFNAQHSPRAGISYRVQDEIRTRMVTALQRDSEVNAGRGPRVIVGHSMGTVIAYDCLQNVPECPKVDAFMTVGSPLGIDEVQDKLKPGWSRENGFPGLKLMGNWANVYDRLDPVAFDPTLADDYQKGGAEVVVDQRQENGGAWRHDMFKYLSKDELRTLLAQQLGVNWP